jgi:hypothetical protein
VAVRFTADGQDLTRSLSLGSLSAFTMACWAKISTDRNSFTTIINVDGGSNEWVVQTTSDGTTLLATDGNTTTTPNIALTAGVWYYIALTMSSGTATLYVRAHNASSFTTGTGTFTSPISVTTLRLGESVYTAEWLNGCIAAVKIWSAALTAAELGNEMWTYVPHRTTSLAAWYPLLRAETTDLSGNGRTLSGSGFSIEDGPPIPWRRGRRRMYVPSEINVEATPGAILAPWSMPAPAVGAGAGASPDVILAPWSMPAPAVEIVEDTPTIAEPAAILAPWSMPAPALEAYKNVSYLAAALQVPWSMPAPFVDVPINPGDGLTGPGQLEWNGFVLGAGTPYSLTNLEGWYDLPGLDPGNVPHPTRHGSNPGRDLSQERIVIFSGLTKGSRANWEEIVENLILATGVGEDDTEYPLAVRLLDQIYVGYGKISRRAIPVDKTFRLGHSRTVLQWTLSDPRLLSKLQSAVIEDGETQTLLNAGNTSASPLIRLPGPSVIPQLLIEPLVGNQVVNERLVELDLTIEADETLIIDVKAGTVSIGEDDKLSALTGSSAPIPDLVFPAGLVRVSYTSEEGDAPPATVLWNHTIL